MEAETLTGAALALLCFHVERDGRIDVEEANRELGWYDPTALSQARLGTINRLG